MSGAALTAIGDSARCKRATNRWPLIAALLLVLLIAGCGGSGVGSSDSTNNSGNQATPPPTGNPTPPQPRFSPSFPPAIGRTEAETLPLVGTLTSGVAANSVTAQAAGASVELTQTASGEWRGELPLGAGPNRIEITVTDTGGVAQTDALADIEQGILLASPSGLVVAGGFAYTLDRGLVQVNLTTGRGQRLPIDLGRGAQLYGQVNGELLVQSQSTLALLNLEDGAQREVSLLRRSISPRPTDYVLDESSGQVYTTIGDFIAVADLNAALPTSFTNLPLEAIPGDVDLLGIDAERGNLWFRQRRGVGFVSETLLRVNLITDERVEVTASARGVPITASVLLADEISAILVDPAGQFFRLQDDQLSPLYVRSLRQGFFSVQDAAGTADAWLVVDSLAGRIERIDTTTGERTALVESSIGEGSAAPGWDGIVFDEQSNAILAHSGLGLQSINSVTGARTDPVETTPVAPGIIASFGSIGANSALTLAASDSELWLARHAQEIEFVRFDRQSATGEVLTSLARADAIFGLPIAPLVAIDPAQNRAWLFDRIGSSAPRRVDLLTGAVVDLDSAVNSRSLLAVLFDPTRGSLLHARAERSTQGGVLRVAELNAEGELLSILVDAEVGQQVPSFVSSPTQMALSEDGSELVICFSDTELIVIADLTTGELEVLGEPLNSISTTISSASAGVALAPDGRLFRTLPFRGLDAMDIETGVAVTFSR